jgi:hypothetical protein
MPPAAGLGFLLANQSPQVSGGLADAWVYDYRRLAGIYPGGWGRTIANAKRVSCKISFSVILNEVKDLNLLKIRVSSLRSE